jgi:hypothetical protein
MNNCNLILIVKKKFFWISWIMGKIVFNDLKGVRDDEKIVSSNVGS